MFTDTNQSYFAKMSSCGVQEELINSIYLPKYFRKGEGERKAEQTKGRKRQFNSTCPTFLWMTTASAYLSLIHISGPDTGAINLDIL